MQILGFYLRRLVCFLCFRNSEKKIDDICEQSMHYTETAPKCRTSKCNFYGCSRTAGFCSVCYRRASAHKPSRIPILVGFPGLDQRYRKRHMHDMLLFKQHDLLKKHDALIAELSEKIKNNQEVTPALISSRGRLPAENSDEEMPDAGNESSHPRNLPIPPTRKQSVEHKGCCTASQSDCHCPENAQRGKHILNYAAEHGSNELKNDPTKQFNLIAKNQLQKL